MKAEEFYEKQRQVAEMRYKKAMSYFDNETYMNGYSIDAVIKVLRLASGIEQFKEKR